jgi:hypothetical protein
LLGLSHEPMLLGKPWKIIDVLLGDDGVKLGGHDAPPWPRCAAVEW